MKYEIRGTTMQTVDVTLGAGESVYTESGGMAWMTPNMEMSSGVKGGLLKGLGRALAGESLFLVDYTCTSGEGTVTFASEFPGNLLDFELKDGQSLICQKDAFLAAQSTVQLAMHFRKRLGAGLFGGEGFILQKLTGPGVVFVELAGEISEYTLQHGQGHKEHIIWWRGAIPGRPEGPWEGVAAEHAACQPRCQACALPTKERLADRQAVPVCASGPIIHP